MDCHGNWTAAVGLMDRSCLPAPPLTLTASILVSFKEPAPPNTELIVRSTVVDVKEGSAPGVGKASVEVVVSVLLPPGPEGGPEKVLATATGIFKKLGALRAL
jgi:acyl dehydratase